VRLNSLQFTVSRALGPSVGALMVKLWGIGPAIFFNAITYLLVVGAIAIVEAHQIIVTEGYRGLRSRAEFEAAQAGPSPLLLSMRR